MPDTYFRVFRDKDKDRYFVQEVVETNGHMKLRTCDPQEGFVTRTLAELEAQNLNLAVDSLHNTVDKQNGKETP